MFVKYEGVVKKNSTQTKVLVLGGTCYYVWTALHSEVDRLRAAGSGEVDNSQLELAKERQIESGMGTLWVPDTPVPMRGVVFHGIVSGGKQRKRILVTLLRGDFNRYFTTVIDGDRAIGLAAGDELLVDERYITPARSDHVAAGLGYGTLERVKRVAR